MKLFVINGPNLNLLGVREPDIYGKKTYADLVAYVEAVCAREGVEVECFQSNHEGALVDIIQSALGAGRTGSSSTPRPTRTRAWPSSTRSRPSPCPRWRCI